MSYKTIPNMYIGLALMLVQFLFINSAFAQEEPKLVEIENRVDIAKPYKARRQSRATVFTLTKDSLNPDKFISAIDGAGYSDLNGKATIDLTRVGLSRKFNFSSLSMAFSLSMATGGSSFSSSSDRSISINSTGLGFGLYLDGMMDEPYVVPFFEGEMAKLTSTEKSADTELKSTYSSASVLSYGVLLQLNWLDTDTALAALNSIGLENTYLRVALQQATLNSGKLDDGAASAPDLTSAGALQLGMVLEF